MLKVDPADVAIEMDVIRSSTTLERARASADPREDPTALVVREGGLAATRLLDALGPLTLAKRAASSCAWVPRARLLRALERVEPLEAIRLAHAASTDVGVWTLVHAATSCRVARHGGRDPQARAVRIAAENEMLGIVYTRCCDVSCNDVAGHDWDDREILDEAGEAVDDTTCTRCGLPMDLYMTWSAWGFGR
jgi:hypothetical protein